ncbi:MAG: hypothetical protein LBR17_09650 [Bacteroidales bacterium]|jgi:hypothetical protein|nr:hypothetical protein [Bacteroidales bacterium]
MIEKIYSHVHLLIIIYVICLSIPLIMAELRVKYILKSTDNTDNLKRYYRQIAKKLLATKICFGVFVGVGLLLCILSSYGIFNENSLRNFPIITPVPIAPFLYFFSIERKLANKL